MRERTTSTSRVMAADRHYGEFYEFYSVSPEHFGYTLVHLISLDPEERDVNYSCTSELFNLL
jgi:hypothetical protein